MRLFKAMVVLVAALDIAMFLQSPSSPLSTRSATQVVGFAAENTNTEAAPLGARF